MKLHYEIESAYTEAIDFAKNHYENFPVLSFLVQKKIYKHVAVIYQYARQADDIADEGENTPEKRLELLDNYENDFNKALAGEYKNKFWLAVDDTIKARKLSPANFTNLLIAFRQDITKKRYSTFDELLKYCENSANPVGRIILELYGIRDETAKFYSDKICTALQITNFLQDVSIDFTNDRIYIPLNELAEYGVDENIFLLKKINSNFQTLMKIQVERVAEFFEEGRRLLPLLPFRLRQQIRWTINGGEGILRKIENLDYNVLNSRPIFSKIDLIKLLFGISVL